MIYTSITPTNQEDYRNAIARLREASPITNKQWLGLVGETMEGDTIFIPGSYEKGYSDSLLPPTQRPHYTWNLLIIGQLSDGTLVFPPSYDSGRSRGINDLKFAVLAEGERRLARKNQELEASNTQIKATLEQANTKLEQLQDEIGDIKNNRQSH